MARFAQQTGLTGGKFQGSVNAPLGGECSLRLHVHGEGGAWHSASREGCIIGYDLHITRMDHWTEAESAPITLEEWLTYVEADPEMRYDGFAEATTTSGETLRVEEEGIAVWTEYSQHGVGGNMAWFYWWRGNVSAKNPDVEIRRKMFAIAQKLNANVQGDEGEHYNQNGEQVL